MAAVVAAARRHRSGELRLARRARVAPSSSSALTGLFFLLALALFAYYFQARTMRHASFTIKSIAALESVGILPQETLVLRGMLGSEEARGSELALLFGQLQQEPAAAPSPRQSRGPDAAANEALPVDYDPDALPNRPFCVPWDVDTDEWWTHRAEWTVDAPSENSTHTCYRRRSAKSGEVFRRIYRIQFSRRHRPDPKDAEEGGLDGSAGRIGGNRSRRCTVRRMWSDGFASDVRSVLDGLVGAYRTGVGFTYDAAPWHYVTLQDGSADPPAPHCGGGGGGDPPDRTMSCYFLALSDCPGRHHDALLPPKEPGDGGGGIEEDGGGGGNYYGHRPPSFVQSKPLLQYVLRPRQWLRRRAYELRRPVQDQLLRAMREAGSGDAAAASSGPVAPSQSSPSPADGVGGAGCTVVHVRRGDVALGNSRSTSRRRYRPLSEYLKHVRTRTVLLLTDDANVLEVEAPQFSNFTFVYWNRTRYRGAEGGWEEHLPSRDPARETAVLVATLELVRACRALVHTASNFGQLLYAQMHPSVRRVNLDAPPP